MGLCAAAAVRSALRALGSGFRDDCVCMCTNALEHPFQVVKRTAHLIAPGSQACDWRSGSYWQWNGGARHRAGQRCDTNERDREWAWDQIER